MRHSAQLLVLLIGLIGHAQAAEGRATGPRQTETLWRGAFRDDSLFVRATWQPTVGDSTCQALAGELDNDSTTAFPTYIDYRVENGRGRVLWTDLVSGPEFGLCCGGLWATATLWHDGLVFIVSDRVSPCEPGGDCDYTRYVYLSRTGAVASSGWDWLKWDPAKPGFAEGTSTMDCIEYAMTFEPRVTGSVLEFNPRFPSSVHEGDLVEKVLDELNGDGCNRDRDPVAVTLDFYPNPTSAAPTRLKIAPTDVVTMVSIIIRAEAGPRGILVPRPVRFGLQVGDRRGYVTLASLRALGYLISADVVEPERR